MTPKKNVIGKVKHYFDQIMVAAIVLDKTLKVGDTVKISGHGKELLQKIESMQIEHEQVTTAKKGQDVAFKVTQPVKENDVVELV
ncbi:MAG: translation elongation factor-like protein [Patescibacteria group bacterium]